MYQCLCKWYFKADARLADGHFLSQETAVNKGKSLNFWTATRMPKVSSKEGQKLKLL
jgi:hypothetical protein